MLRRAFVWKLLSGLFFWGKGGCGLFLGFFEILERGGGLVLQCGVVGLWCFWFMGLRLGLG